MNVCDQDLHPADVFISSTFVDMQQERDILSRLVFPRLRDSFKDKFQVIREIDLRWGVNNVMSSYEGAVNICLEEIERCTPFVLGMLGHRIGWQPSLKFVERKFRNVVRTKPPGTSLTELEISYAALLATRHKLCRPLILVRSNSLSERVIEKLDFTKNPIKVDSLEEVYNLRKFICNNLDVVVKEYDSFERFEELAEQGLTEQFCDSLNSGSTKTILAPDLSRRKIIKKIDRVSRRRAVMLAGETGSGKSWLARRWLQRDDSSATYIIDGRVVNATAFGSILSSEQTLNSDFDPLGIMQALTSLPIHSRVIFDHFDDAFSTSAMSDLTVFPSIQPKDVTFIVISKSERLLRQARALNWEIVEVTTPNNDELLPFVRSYLQTYGKHLTQEQLRRFLTAPWTNRFGSVVLALEELRRFGRMEELDDRINQLISSDGEMGLAREVLNGINSVLPMPWRDVVIKILLLLNASSNGLEESLIRQAVRTNKQELPNSIWSAIRFSLQSTFRLRGNRIDIAEGPMSDVIFEFMQSNREYTEKTLQQFAPLLDNMTSSRRAEELPSLHFLKGGLQALSNWLIEPEHFLSIYKVGSIFATGWFEKLDGEQQSLVADRWIEKVEDQADGAWTLGKVAAQVGLKAQAESLFRIDANWTPTRPERDLMFAHISKDTGSIRSITTSYIQSLRKHNNTNVDLTRLLFVLGYLADGTVTLPRDEINELTRIACNSKAVRIDPGTWAQIKIAVGQIAMNTANWKTAKKEFEGAQSLARSVGHARLLCFALERLAVVCLELNKFRIARNVAEECRHLAKSLGLFRFESLAFERIIEVYIRRADWQNAYSLIETYFRRCDEMNGDISRPQHTLNAIEQAQL